MFSNDCECKNRALVYPNCNPCGDGTCDKNLENCVTCPQDCSSTSCGMLLISHLFNILSYCLLLLFRLMWGSFL